MESTAKQTIALSCYDGNKDNIYLSDTLIIDDNVVINSAITATIPKTTEEIFQHLLEGVEKIDFESLAFNGTYDDKIEEFNQREEDDGLPLNEDGSSERSVKSAPNDQLKKLTSFVVTKNHYVIITVEQLIKTSKKIDWGL